MAAVFPESMDRLDPGDVAGSLRTVENYIRYMGERTQFAMAGVTRSVEGAGVSSAEIAGQLEALRNDLSALASAVNLTTGEINMINTRLSAVADGLDAVRGGLSALEARVAALEGAGNGSSV